MSLVFWCLYSFRRKTVNNTQYPIALRRNRYDNLNRICCCAEYPAHLLTIFYLVENIYGICLFQQYAKMIQNKPME